VFLSLLTCTRVVYILITYQLYIGFFYLDYIQVGHLSKKVIQFGCMIYMTIIYADNC